MMPTGDIVQVGIAFMGSDLQYVWLGTAQIKKYIIECYGALFP